MARGHVERLAPMVNDVLREAGVAAGDLDVIAVTTGPGSFTGARLGVAFARGLALASGARAVGVTVFEVLARAVPEGIAVVALDGRRGDIFLQRFDEGVAAFAPVAVPVGEAWRVMEGLERMTLFGSGRDAVLAHAPSAMQTVPDAPMHVDAAVVARIGAERVEAGVSARPAPFYLRAPDAKPQMAGLAGG